MLESGISEEVVLSYITNSPKAYNVNSDTVIYLNDLGVSSTVMTALIQQDASPENAASKAAASAVQPLPPGVALTTPATNVYLPTINSLAEPPAASGYVAAAPAAGEAPVAQYPANPAPESPTVTYFYDSLAPYGSWVQAEDYGWVWQPTVAVVNPGWRPYTDHGRWLWSDSGWYWYSDYSWGWAPFHYGRWFTHPRRGWVWMPDTCWGPSWVTWRHTSYYCGWAPLPPDCHFVQGVGLHYRSHQVALDFDFGFAPGFYTWIHLNRFCDPYPHHYYVPNHHIRDFYRDSVIVNNIHVSGGGAIIFNDGIGFQRVSRATRSDIPRLAVIQAPPDPRRGGRFERLEYHGDRLAVVRPPPPGPGQPHPGGPGPRPGGPQPPSAPNPPPGLASRPSPPSPPSQPTPGMDRAPGPPATASRARPVLPSRVAPAQPTQPRQPLSSLLADTKNAPPAAQPANRQPPANTERRNGAAPAAPASPTTPASPNIARAPSQTPMLREPGVLNRPVRSAAGTSPQEPSRPALTPSAASAPQASARQAPTPPANRPAASSPKAEPQRTAPVVAPPFQPRTDRSSSISTYKVQEVQPSQRTLSRPVNSAPVARPSSSGSSPSAAPRSAEAVRSISPSSRPSAPAMSAPSAPQREFRSAPVMRSEPPAVRSAPAEVRSAPSAPSPSRSAPAPSSAPSSRGSSSGKSGKKD